MNAARIDVSRLIRIATVLFAVGAAMFVYVAYQPQLEALQSRIDDGQSELRSDEVAFREVTVLRGERQQLSDRYAHLFAQNPQAVFVRELGTIVHRHGVTLISTNVTQDAANADSGAPGALFTKTHVTIVLGGTYRTLLGAISDLSNGSEIVEVQEPSLSRDNAAVLATIPVNIYEPLRGLQPASATTVRE